MFQAPMDEIVYENPVDIHAFGVPLTEEEKQFKTLVPADKHSVFAGRCTVEKCVEKIWEETPLCKKHAYDMWFKVELNKHIDEDRKVHDQLKADAVNRQAQFEDNEDQLQQMKDNILHEQWRSRAIAEEAAVEFKTRPGTVYYLLVGDHIKIGFSTNVEERVKAYPPYAKLLAQHPGSVETERWVHNKFFSSLAYGREWFTPSDELMRHIESIDTNCTIKSAGLVD